MRRLAIGTTAVVVFTGTFLVLPVSAAPGPAPTPVPTSDDQVAMGSVEDPAPAADVQQGTTEPVAGVPDTAPTLTVSLPGNEDFSLVGVTWRHDGAIDDVAVQIRVRDTTGVWGEWTDVASEDAEPNPGATPDGELRGGTEPLWTGASTGIEAEVATRRGAAPTDVRLELIDPGDSAADAAVGASAVQDTANAATAMPTIYTRRQWGADERIRTWAPRYATALKAATVHHTAGANGYGAAEVPQIIRSIYHYHAVSRGWGDIGYNVMVDRFGRAWEGRYGGLPSTVMGAHAGGFNTGTFGISMLGDLDRAPASAVMVETVSAAIAWKLSLHGVDPRGSVTLTSSGGGTSKYAAGARVTLPTIFAHRDVGNTTCPGVYGFARMGEIRDRVARLVAATPQPTIDERYAADADVRSLLGAAVGTTQQTAGVTWREYERGSMYWTATTGARAVTGTMLDTYLGAGGPAALGAPATDEQVSLDGVGRYIHFSRSASIYSSPATGAHVVRGAIRTLWARTGAETGPLGYPVTSELPLAAGRYSDFQRGTVYWDPTTGAAEVHGSIATRWRALGGLAWGVPTSSELSAGAGVRYNTFSGGRALYWTSAAGAKVLQGPILRHWLALGGPSGWLGYPTSDETAAAGGVRYNTFRTGTVYWTSTGGAVSVQGTIARKYAALGGPAGLGLPIGDEAWARDGVGRFSSFAKGASIYWTPATGAWSVRGSIRGLWARLGAETGPLRYPVSDERATPDGAGRYSAFQSGAVYWRAGRGAFAVYGSIHRRYLALGGVSSALGYPTSNEYAVPGGRASNFEHGRILWDSRTRATTVVPG